MWCRAFNQSQAWKRCTPTRSITRHYANASGPRTPSPRARIERLEARLPRFLRSWTTPLRNAPVSHVTAFVILHELTAVVPLFGLAAMFHYTEWLPPQLMGNKYVVEGTERFGRWLRKKGWVTIAEEEEAEAVGHVETQDSHKVLERQEQVDGHNGVRLVLEFATAYAITKALLPVRLAASVWFTPWFARWTVVPLTNVFRRISPRKGVVNKTAK